MRVRILVGLLLFFISLVGFAAEPRFTLVSDIDDTVKISNVLELPSLIGRTFFKKEAFAGMSELYFELIRSAQTGEGGQDRVSLHFVSSGPTFLSRSLHEFLNRAGFPFRALFLRDWFQQRDAVAFKTQALEELNQQVSTPWVMLGDDTEADPEVYDGFLRKKESQQKISAIYIRRVVGSARLIPVGMQEFYSALDVALAEFQQGRLDLEQVEKVAMSLKSARDEKIIPGFAACPPMDWVQSYVEPKLKGIPPKNSLLMTIFEIYEKIQNHCMARSRL